MWTTLQVAASGAQAQEKALDAAAHNLANAQTPGYKSRRVALMDQAPGQSVFTLPTRAGGITMTSEATGQGATAGALLTDLAPGQLQSTGRPLDVAVLGNGYLEVQLPDGGAAYTRAGTLHPDEQGRLVTPDGATVAGVAIPPGAGHLSIAVDGTVTGQIGAGARLTLGRLQLASFTNPEGLDPMGQNLLRATAASGPATVGDPGTNGLGLLAPEKLEGSNVDVTEEMTRIIQAQRAYQINLRALKTVDEMLQTANNFNH